MDNGHFIHQYKAVSPISLGHSWPVWQQHRRL